jgi:Ser/Thr protein kinase RdoA (MazF antagonist)
MSDFYPVVCSYLDPKALLCSINERYEMKTETCQLWNSGVNAVYKLCTDMGILYLRVSHAARYSRKDYEEEVYIINLLHKQDVPAMTPIADKNSEYIWEIHAPEGTRYAIIFHEAKNAASGSSINQLYNIGVTAAKFHRVADEMNFTVSREPILWHQLSEHPIEMLAEPLRERQADIELLKTCSKELQNFIETKIPKKEPYYGFCHGDMHNGNVFFYGEDPQIFDFDCMGYGYRAYDICIFAWSKTFGQEDYIKSDEWKKYLEGYSSIRKLEEAELSCISALAALRQIWLMGLHLDGTKINSEWAWLNDGYFDFHIKIFKLWYYRTFPEQKPAEEVNNNI